MAEIPSPAETGYYVAWVNYAKTALDSAPLLGVSRYEWAEALYYFAEDVEPGTDIKSYDLYEDFVFDAARYSLPSGAPDKAGRQAKDNDVLARALTKIIPRSKHLIPKEAESSRDKQLHIERMVAVVALERLGLAKHNRTRRLIVPAGAISASAYFRGNIHSEFDREVYKQADVIKKSASAYPLLQRRIGHQFAYQAMGRLAPAREKVSIEQTDGNIMGFDSLHDAFWYEVKQDRQRFALRKQAIIENLQTAAGSLNPAHGAGS